MRRYDGKGPLRAESHARRRLRRCGRLADDRTAVADPYHDCGLGWSHWPGVRDRGRRSPRAGRASAAPAPSDAVLGQRRAFLGRRIEALTEELDRVKALFAEYARREASNGE